MGYSEGVHAPGIKSHTGQYTCGRVVLLAHARAYHSMHKVLKDIRIGMAINSDWAEPYSNTPEDIGASIRVMEFSLGWFMDPLYFGQYPESMLKRIPRDILPKFSPEESKLLERTVDFFGYNHYTTRFIKHNNYPLERDYLAIKMLTSRDGVPIGDRGESDWLYSVGWGIQKAVEWIDKRYEHPEIVITENGASEPNEGNKTSHQAYNDVFRVEYFKSYLSYLERAKQNGVNISIYFAWSLLDNFEWNNGYIERFGLYYVDFNDPERKRTPKKSAKYLKEYFSSGKRAHDIYLTYD